MMHVVPAVHVPRLHAEPEGGMQVMYRAGNLDTLLIRTTAVQE